MYWSVKMMVKHYYNSLLFSFFLFTLPHLKAIKKLYFRCLKLDVLYFFGNQVSRLSKKPCTYIILIRNICILFYVALKDVENTVVLWHNGVRLLLYGLKQFFCFYWVKYYIYTKNLKSAIRLFAQYNTLISESVYRNITLYLIFY